MRRMMTTVLGLLAAWTGGLVFARNMGPLYRLQIGLSELPFIPALLGLIAIVRGLRRRHQAGLLLGGLGFVAAMWPIVWILPTLINMEEAMQRGLGSDYQLHIPPAMWPRIAPYHLSLLNTLGRRNIVPRAAVSHDVPYSHPGIRSLKLDIYQPEIPPGVGSRYPAILALHPGSWQAGDKGQWFAPHHRYLASQGYVVFDVQYRLSQEAIWPAQLEDVRCAMQWIQAHADTYQVDIDRVALLGRSAGAQLALRAAYDANPTPACSRGDCAL